MLKCSVCEKEMKIHENGFFEKVWKCESTSSHPTVTTTGDGTIVLRLLGAGFAFFGGHHALAASLFFGDDS